MPNVRRLPVIPLAEPVQLVLALDGIGIRRPKRRRKARHPWMPEPRAVAA